MLNVARGGGNTTSKFACKDNCAENNSITNETKLEQLCIPIETECCFNNNISNLNTDYKCSKDDITANTNPTSLFTDKFAPCSKIIAQVNKADCKDIKDENIIADTKKCYGGPKDNFYVEGNEIKQCPVIASTTNHNYDDNAAYTDNEGNGNRTNPNWSKFNASSCKFYGKNSKNNKTGFCDNGGKNCLYFDNDYEIEQITICNNNDKCYKYENGIKKYID